MELPIKTVVMLVVLLVLVAVLLILLSRGGNNLTDIGGDVSECEILCWECCRGQGKDCSETSSTAGP